jgi:hypothetical protein
MGANKEKEILKKAKDNSKKQSPILNNTRGVE